jgi:hypothetical protein
MWPLQPPEGSPVMAPHSSEHGIVGINAPFEALLGVFLGDERPDRSRAPKPLEFDTKHRSFTTCSPQLKQVFYIGSGIAPSGDKRRYLIPAGATRLFLATMDGYGWNNNTGAHIATVTLERTTS